MARDQVRQEEEEGGCRAGSEAEEALLVEYLRGAAVAQVLSLEELERLRSSDWVTRFPYVFRSRKILKSRTKDCNFLFCFYGVV